jgi:phosphoglycerate transporter family protein
MRRRILPHLAKNLDAAINPEEPIIDSLALPRKNGGLSAADASIYSQWRFRILAATMFGYATFYLVRLNFSVAIPTLQAEFGYSKADLGMVITIFSVVYGVGKFLNGYFGDRSNARYFMTIGLIGSAIINLFVGFGEGLLFFGGCWAVNAWFQSMGWPPVARLLTHWFGPQEIATKWAIWNCSQPIGGAVIYVFAGYLISNYGWQSAFYIPAILGLVVSALLYHQLRDTPQSLGLPPVEVYTNLIHKDDVVEEEHVSTREILRRVFSSKIVWYVCMGNMFLYVVRMGAFTWAPTFLQEMKGSSIVTAGWQSAGFEIAGLCGGLVAGWVSDRLMKGRRGPVSCVYMAALALVLLYFWQAPAGYMWIDSIAMLGVGFLVYGPQVLVGVAAADFASKKAAGMATGLTGTFGYLGAAVSGYGVGKIVDVWGWGGGFTFFICSALLGMCFFALTWTARSKILERAEANA